MPMKLSELTGLILAFITSDTGQTHQSVSHVEHDSIIEAVTPQP